MITDNTNIFIIADDWTTRAAIITEKQYNTFCSFFDKYNIEGIGIEYVLLEEDCITFFPLRRGERPISVALDKKEHKFMQWLMDFDFFNYIDTYTWNILTFGEIARLG